MACTELQGTTGKRKSSPGEAYDQKVRELGLSLKTKRLIENLCIAHSSSPRCYRKSLGSPAFDTRAKKKKNLYKIK